MPPQFLPLLVLLLVSLSGLATAGEGVQRTWTSEDNTRKLEARFVRLRGEMLTLLPKDKPAMVFPLKLLATPDQEIARTFGTLFPDGVPDERITVLSMFRPGSTMAEVQEAVRGCKELTGGLPKELLGRTGLNGVYSVQVAGQSFHLFFGFDETDRLTDVSLHGAPLDAAEFDQAARKSWAKARQILLAQFGAPGLTLGYPDSNSFAADQVMFSDWWLDGKGNHALGIGKTDHKLMVVIRLTNQQPRTVPR